MKVSQKAIKRLIQTGAAIDVTKAENLRRPSDSTIVFYSCNSYGQLNGIVLIDNVNGQLYAVADRCGNMLIYAA